MKMPVPDPENAFFLSKWFQEVILGIIVIFTFVLKFIGNKLGGDKTLYATKTELAACSLAVGGKIDLVEERATRIEAKLDKIDERIDNHMDK